MSNRVAPGEKAHLALRCLQKSIIKACGSEIVVAILIIHLHSYMFSDTN